MKNTSNHYGRVTIVLHWIVAVTVIGLFALGFWMVDLGHYDPWYQQGPDLHKSIGILLFLVMVFRVFWQKFQVTPKTIESHSHVEKKIGTMVHSFLYFSLFILMISGYLISTADGRAIEVFQLFSIVSIGELFADQEDLSGMFHKYLAYVLITVVVLHALASLKHHFIDKDKTLLRMLGFRSAE